MVNKSEWRVNAVQPTGLARALRARDCNSLLVKVLHSRPRLNVVVHERHLEETWIVEVGVKRDKFGVRQLLPNLCRLYSRDEDCPPFGILYPLLEDLRKSQGAEPRRKIVGQVN